MKKIYSISLLATIIAVMMLSVPLQASQTDEQIVSSAQQSHVFKTYLKDDDVNIRSKDGAVTLTGTVSEESHKQLAHETVAGQPGVKSVDNKLEIIGESPAEYSDAWLMTKVKTSLLFKSSVSGFATEVDVKDGIVTLGGEADSQAQKDLTTEYAKDIDGVKEVKNEMRVAKSPKKSDGKTMGEQIDDASITALAKSTLLYHRSTSGIKTKVTTSDGVVTLSGSAKNEAEKDLAAKRVSDVSGVKKVVNNMTVQ